MVMGLHPLKSRRKRAENAITILLFGMIVAVLAGLSALGQPGSDWHDALRMAGPLVIGIVSSLGAVWAYVRGGN
jgi:hypothetical protein